MPGSVIEILTDIGPDEWGFVGAETVSRELAEMGEVDEIDVLINSPGGMAFEGISIYNLLSQHPATVNVKVLGWAASAASIISMAGDTITMAGNATMMIHNALILMVGNAAELRKEADVLEGLDKQIANTYVARTGQKFAKVKQMMDDETWLSAEEAKKLGFADTVAELKSPSNHIDVEQAIQRYSYHNLPKEVLTRTKGERAAIKLARPDWLKKHLTNRRKSA